MYIMKYIKRYEIFENISSVTEKELFNLCDYALALFWIMALIILSTMIL